MTKKNEKKSERLHQGQRLSVLWLCFLTFVFGYLAASWFDVNQLVKWIGDRFVSQPVAEKIVEKKADIVKPVKEQHPKLEFYTLLTNDAGVHTVTLDTSNSDVTNKDSMQKNIANASTATPPSGPMELALTSSTAESVAKPNPNPSPLSAQESATPAKVASPARPVLPKPVNDELKRVSNLASNPTPVVVNDRYKGRYVIQVASFRSQIEAKRLREKLAQRRYNAYIVPVMQQSTYWYRVIVGPFSSLGQAQQVQNALSYQEHIRGIIRKN